MKKIEKFQMSEVIQNLGGRYKFTIPPLPPRAPEVEASIKTKAEAKRARKAAKRAS